MIILKCSYCGYEREGQADSAFYCGPHVASFGGATYPKAKMVPKADRPLIPAPSVAEAAEAAEPVAFMDEEGNLFAKSNMPIAEILRALPTPPVGRKLLPLYTHPAPPPVVPSGLEALVPDYDAGLLNDYGAGDVAWWQDYLRAEISRANDHWRERHTDAIATLRALADRKEGDA